MPKILSVCDVENEYAEKLMAYLSESRSLPFQVQVFTSVDALLAFAEKKPIEVLLISERAYCEAVEQVNAASVILLTENGELKNKVSYPKVYKYQSSGRVVREVIDCYSAERMLTGTEVYTGKKRERIGVSGISDPWMKTIGALTAARILAERKSVLYINLERFSGVVPLLFENTGEEEQKGLSDLLYIYRQKREGTAFQLTGCVRKWNNVDLLFPVNDPDDLEVMTVSEWPGFVEELQKSSRYDCILLEFDSDLRGFEELIETCSRFIMTEKEDPISRTQAENRLRYAGIAEEKVQIISVPYETGKAIGPYYLEAQMQGKAGETMRTLLKETERAE
ncbi:MAG: hypothetical protein Q4B22_00215 [Eubacteriales bacterium]|nr:hypothetical protein [Eubacteriales bacterium]